MGDFEQCKWCKGQFKKNSSVAVHPYMESSPGCWACYGEVLSREYSNRQAFEKGAVHKLTVDTYAAQHPGNPSPQSIRSVGYHLIRLCMILDKKLAPEQTQQFMIQVTKLKESFWWLEPPSNMGAVTVLDVHNTKTPEQHIKAVNLWAESVWQSWEDHHSTIYSWLP